MKRRVVVSIVLAVAVFVGPGSASQLEDAVTEAKTAYERDPNAQTLGALDAAVAAFKAALPARAATTKAMATETEPNDTAGTANSIATGDYMVADLTPVGDVDYFVNGGNAVSDLVYAAVNTAGSSTGTDSQLNTYANDGTTLIEFDDDGGPGLASCVAGGVVPQAGGVYFAVNEYGNNGEITPYELHQVVAPATAVAAESEPNDTSATATPVASTFVSGDNPVGAADVDYFSFPGEAGDIVQVIVDDDPDGDGSNFDSELDILDVDGSTVLAAGDDGSSNPNNCAGSVVLAAAGTYFVRIGDGGSGTDTDYQFTVVINGASVPVELQSFSID